MSNTLEVNPEKEVLPERIQFGKSCTEETKEYIKGMWNHDNLSYAEYDSGGGSREEEKLAQLGKGMLSQ